MNEITRRSQFTHIENTGSSFLSSIASVVSAGGNIWADGIGHIVDGHGLQPDTTGAGQHCIKQAFATEEDTH